MRFGYLWVILVVDSLIPVSYFFCALANLVDLLGAVKLVLSRKEAVEKGVSGTRTRHKWASRAGIYEVVNGS